MKVWMEREEREEKRERREEREREKKERNPPVSWRVFNPGRVLLPTELKLNPPTQQFVNV